MCVIIIQLDTYKLEESVSLQKKMALFNHKIRLAQLLKEIPEAELSNLAKDTKVDYYTKVLSGKLMFYLLLYGILHVDRLSQRGLADAFSSPMFKLIFNTGGRKSISHSSISERFSTIELSFFEKAYECIYKRFSSLYTRPEIAGMKLERVDSTLVGEASNKLLEGITCGNQYKKKNMIKYTINFDGMFASLGCAHSQMEYTSESIALPQNIMSHFKKVKDHASVYLFDRGLSTGSKLSEMSNTDNLFFVGRLSENSRIDIVEAREVEEVEFDGGTLIQDDMVHIYGRSEKAEANKRASSRKIPDLFRVVRFIPALSEKEILLITNILELPAQDIAKMYKRRWDIEVFFRFLKQELNFSHFVSLNKNGVQVVMYMTMITAMLVMIYKKENGIGYKTAVRRMGIELEELVLAIVVIQSGGDLSKVDLPAP